MKALVAQLSTWLNIHLANRVNRR